MKEKLQFKNGELVKVKKTLRTYKTQYGVILKYTYSGYKANYYECLLNNKIDIVADTWIESIL